MTTQSPSIDEVFEALSPTVCDLSEPEQRLALGLYQQLAQGHPVARDQLAETMTLTTEEVTGLLDRAGLKSLVYNDKQGRIIGFGGLAVVPMNHRFTIGGRTLYTWCAWDGLFLPELLDAEAEIASTCPQTQRSIRLTVTPSGVQATDPSETVVSFLLPDAPLFEQTTAETISSFCHFIYFLASPEAGVAWTAQHEGTFLLPLNDAFQLGRMNNAARFGDALRIDRHR